LNVASLVLLPALHLGVKLSNHMKMLAALRAKMSNHMKMLAALRAKMSNYMKMLAAPRAKLLFYAPQTPPQRKENSA
jgi:hypothetical protein